MGLFGGGERIPELRAKERPARKHPGRPRSRESSVAYLRISVSHAPGGCAANTGIAALAIATAAKPM